MKTKKLLSFFMVVAMVFSIIAIPELTMAAEDLYESDLSGSVTQNVSNQAFKWGLTGGATNAAVNMGLSTSGANYTAYWEPPTAEEGFDVNADWSLTLDWCKKGGCEFMIMTGSGVKSGEFTRRLASAGNATYQMDIKRENGVIYYKRNTVTTFTNLTDGDLSASNVLRAVGIRQTDTSGSWIDNVVLTQGDKTWTEDFDMATHRDFQNSALKISDYFKPSAKIVATGVTTTNKAIKLPAGGYGYFILPTITNGVYEIEADYRVVGKWCDYLYIGYADGTRTEISINQNALDSYSGNSDKLTVTIDADNNTVTTSYVRDDGTALGGTTELKDASINSLIFRNHANATTDAYVDNVKVTRVSGSEEFTPVLDGETLLYKNDFESGDLGSTSVDSATGGIGIQYSAKVLGKQGYGMTANLVTGDYTANQRFANITMPTQVDLEGTYRIRFSVNSYGGANAVNALYLVSTYNPDYSVDRDKVEVLSTSTMNAISTWTDMELVYDYPSGEWTIYNVTDVNNPVVLNSGTWTQTEQSGNKVLPKLSWRLQSPDGGYKNNLAPAIDNLYITKDAEEVIVYEPGVLYAESFDDVSEEKLTEWNNNSNYKNKNSWYFKNGASLEEGKLKLASAAGSTGAYAYLVLPQLNEGITRVTADYTVSGSWWDYLYVYYTDDTSTNVSLNQDALNTQGGHSAPLTITINNEEGTIVTHYQRADGTDCGGSYTFDSSKTVAKILFRNHNNATMSSYLDNVTIRLIGEAETYEPGVIYTEDFASMSAPQVTEWKGNYDYLVKEGWYFGNGISVADGKLKLAEAAGGTGAYAHLVLPELNEGVTRVTADYTVSGSWCDYIHVYYTDGTSTNVSLNQDRLNAQGGHSAPLTITINNEEGTIVTSYKRADGVNCGESYTFDSTKTVARIRFRNHNNATMAAYLDNVVVELRNNVGLGVTLVNGAQVRYGAGVTEEGKVNQVAEGSGLRFIATVDYNDTLAVVADEIGIKIEAQGSDEVIYIPATKFQDESNTIFSAAITNLAVSNYNRNYTATPYVKIGDEYTYGDSVTRSIYQVSAGLLKYGVVTDENTDQLMNPAIVDVLQAYVNQVGIRINLKVSGAVEATTTGNGAYTGEALFTVACTEADGAYTITVTPIDGAHNLEIADFWKEYVRINNNNSAVKTMISDATIDEDGVLTFTFTPTV